MATPQRLGSQLPHHEDGLLLLYIRNSDEVRLAREFRNMSQRELASRCKCSHTLIYKVEHGQTVRIGEDTAKLISQTLDLDWRSVFSATRPSDTGQSVNRPQPEDEQCTRNVFSFDGSAGS